MRRGWRPCASKCLNMPRLLSVNVGLPRDIEWNGRTVHTAIWKSPVSGRCHARRLNLDGDGQGDLAGHGGEQRAVFVYQIESCRYWAALLKRPDLDDPSSAGQSVRISQSKDCPTIRCASGAAFELAARSSRLRNLGLPAIGLAFG